MHRLRGPRKHGTHRDAASISWKAYTLHEKTWPCLPRLCGLPCVASRYPRAGRQNASWSASAPVKNVSCEGGRFLNPIERKAGKPERDRVSLLLQALRPVLREQPLNHVPLRPAHAAGAVAAEKG